MKPGPAPIKQKAVVRGKRIEVRHVTKFPVRYRKAIHVQLREVGGK